MKHILAVTALAMLAAATAAAGDDIRSKPLTLHPPAPAARALQYALLPELQDSLPGNAVDHYRQAIKNLQQDLPPGREWYEKYEPWLAAPLKDLPHDDVAKFLRQCDSTLRELDAGACSEDCDWGLIADMRKEGQGWRPHDLTGLHQTIVPLLILRLRLEVGEGRFDGAARSLRTGFALARHLGDAPSLSYAMTGLGTAAVMEGELEELIQQPHAPNFYWPLTDLPRPLFDLHKPWQGERIKAYADFPGMTEMAADVNAKPFTNEQLNAILKAIDESDPVADVDKRAKNKAAQAWHLALRHKTAKAALVAQGRPAELVDAMHPAQVGCMVALLQYDQALDEILKWQSLPFWEAQPAMERELVQQLQRADGPDGSAVPITRRYLSTAALMLPHCARLERRLDALRCVEALRLYAAAHEGKFPAALDDIKDVPVPDDPVTGKPFGYHLVGDRAFLTSTPFPDQPANNAAAPTYELIFSR